MSEKYTVQIEYDEETGDQVIPLPEKLLLDLNWFPGDIIVWEANNDGSFTLSKKEFENA